MKKKSKEKIIKKYPGFDFRYNYKRKINYAWFRDNTYRAGIVLCWPVNNEDLTYLIKDLYNLDYGNIKDFAARCSEIVDNNDCEICNIISLRDWVFNPRWISYLTHECVHCARHIFVQRNINYNSNDGDEPFAYFVESLVRRCLDILKGNY